MADIRTILASNANSSLMKKRKEKHQAAAIEIEEEKEKAVESLMKVQPSFSSVRDSGEALYGVALGDFPLSDDVLGRDEILNENGHIISGLVATESMLSNSIEGDRIVSGSLSGKKIKDGTIESSKIGQKQIKESNLDDSAVTTNKIRDRSVTPEKLSKTYAEASSLTGYVPLSGGDVSSEFALKIGGIDVLGGLNDRVKIGKSAIAYDENSIAVGISAESSSENAIAIGLSSYASGTGSIALGVGAKETNGGIAIGMDSESNGAAGIVVGKKALGAGYGSIAIGFHAKVSGDNSIAIGEYSEAPGEKATAIGMISKALSAESTAIGYNSRAEEDRATAIGGGAQADCSAAVAIGWGAVANAPDSIAIGYESENSSEGTLQVWNYRLLQKSDGKIPVERIPDLQTSKVTDLQNKLDSKLSGVMMNGAVVQGVDGIANLGTVLTAHQSLSEYALKTEIPLSVGQLINDKNYVTSSDLNLLQVLKYKGSVNTYSELPPDDENQIGDVWNVVEAHGDDPAGTNYAWSEDSTWDPLGGSIDVSVFAKNDAVVHLSGNEVLSGRLSADFFHSIENPLYGMYVWAVPIGTGLSSLGGLVSYGEVNPLPAQMLINDFVQFAGDEEYTGEPGITIFNESVVVVLMENNWTAWADSIRGVELFLDTMPMHIEIQGFYDSSLPGDQSGAADFETNFSDIASIKQMLIDVATGTRPVPIDGERVLSVNWEISFSTIGGSTSITGNVNNGEIFNPHNSTFTDLYEPQTNEFLSTWTDHDEFALTSEIKEATSPLSAAIEKALTAEIDPKFTAWLSSKGNINIGYGPVTFKGNPTKANCIEIGPRISSNTNDNIIIACSQYNSNLSVTNSVATHDPGLAGGNIILGGWGTIDAARSILFGPTLHANSEFAPKSTPKFLKSLILNPDSSDIGDLKYSNPEKVVGATSIGAPIEHFKRYSSNSDYKYFLSSDVPNVVSDPIESYCFYANGYKVLNSNGKIPSDRIDYASIEKSAIPLSGGIVSLNKLFQDSGGNGAYNPNTDCNYWELGELAYPNGKNNPSRYIPIFKVTRPWDTLLRYDTGVDSISGGANLFIGLDAKALGTTNNGFDMIPRASIAIGSAAQISSSETIRTNKAIQLGNGINSNSNTFQVWDHTLMDANGNIPYGRLSSIVPILEAANGSYSAFAIGIRKLNAPIGANSFTVGVQNAAIANNSIATGYQTSSIALWSEAHGTKSNTGVLSTVEIIDPDTGESTEVLSVLSALSYAGGSYVWQGLSENYAKTSTYYSHGQGTYNINPKGGLSGFYIGENNLATILNNYSPAGDYISKQALRDALSSNLSTLLPVNYNDPQSAELSVLWKNVGILQNALSSVMEMANS